MEDMAGELDIADVEDRIYNLAIAGVDEETKSMRGRFGIEVITAGAKDEMEGTGDMDILQPHHQPHRGSGGRAEEHGRRDRGHHQR
jgi:hypothetical protein